MGFEKTVEIGRVAYISKGTDSGNLAAIVDVIDQNRGLIDGPKVRRQVASFQNLYLTKFKVNVQHSARHKTVLKAWDEAKVEEQWKNSNWAKKLDRTEKRANMNDFDRFKLMRAKQARNKVIKLEFGRLKREANKSKSGEKPKQKKEGKRPVPEKKEAKKPAPEKKEAKKEKAQKK